MSVSLAVVWWGLAGIAVVLELLTGTLYLLMLAVGMVCGALAAHMGMGFGAQLLVFAMVTVATLSTCFWLRRSKGRHAAEEDMTGLDVGQRVQVSAWEPDGTAYVQYRGARWQVQLQQGQQPTAGEFKVVDMVGSRLIVARAQQEAPGAMREDETRSV